MTAGAAAAGRHAGLVLVLVLALLWIPAPAGAGSPGTRDTGSASPKPPKSATHAGDLLQELGLGLLVVLLFWGIGGRTADDAGKVHPDTDRLARHASAPPGTPGVTDAALVRAWASGAATVLCLTAATNLLLDPWALYGTGLVAPRSSELRRLKAEGYAALEEPPTLVVQGSSQALVLRARSLRRKLGVPVFNSAVDDGRVDDFVVQTRLLARSHGGVLPAVFLVQVSPTLVFAPERTAFLTPLAQLPYLRPRTALAAVRQRLYQLVSAAQVEASLDLLSAVLSGTAPPPVELRPSGDRVFRAPSARHQSAARRRNLARQLERSVELAVATHRRPACGAFDAEAVAELETLVELITSAGSAAVLYYSPYHPRYVEQVLNRSGPLAPCLLRTAELLSSLARADELVFFVDFLDSRRFGGVASERGFFDYRHMTEYNGELLIDALRPTLEQALRVAAARRGE